MLIYPPSGAVLMDVALAIDGIPQREAFEALLDSIAAAADEDRNGLLSWEEAANSDLILGPLTESADQPMIFTSESLRDRFDHNKNDLVERRELSRMLVEEGRNSQPFSVVTSSDLGIAEAAESTLFRFLDANDDGALDTDELEQGAARLSRRDFDMDGYLAREELASRPSAPGMPMMQDRRALSDYGPPVLDWIRQDPSWHTIYYTLTEWYSAGDILAVDCFPDASDFWGQLDVDRDQNISITEIKSLDKIPPHITLTIDFAHGELQFDATSSQSSWQSRLLLKTQDDPALTIDLKPTPIHVSLVNGTQSTNAPIYPPNAIDNLDSDGDHRFSVAELEASGILSWKPYEKLDRDRDGQVSSQEVLDTIGRLSDYQVVLTAAVTTTDPWSILDSDGDGRLHLREAARAAELLGVLDVNHDQRVTGVELPRQIQLRFVRGAEQDGDGGDPASDSDHQDLDDNRPRWFRHTDTNRDGEITWDEFLGTRAQFGTLDADQNGVVTPSEAK